MSSPLRSALRPVLLPILLLVQGCGEPPAPEAEPTDPDVIPAWLQEVMEGDPTAEPQAHSLFGEPLYARMDETGAVAAADEALRLDPGNVDLLIEAGRVRRNAWQYRQEMAFYTRAEELAPDDWRIPRFRGHRHLSVREFDQGIRDLERARELAPLNWDVSYHLGLAYYLAGRFDQAADEYLRCLELAEDTEARAAVSPGFRSCSANGDDPESLVAMAEWAVRALERSGRADEARTWVEAVPGDLPVSENLAYYHTLLMDQGAMTEEELLGAAGPDGPYRLETVGYGIAARHLARGERDRAVELLRDVMEDGWWPGFGRLAAEADLARLGEAPR
jgi:tetratricopeptide (TPR) repeat protein